MVRLLAPDLLGRHVADRPHDGAGFGHGSEVEGLAPARFGGRRGLGLPYLGQSEVQHLDPALVGEEDVLGLEVAVDDPFLVRGREGVADLEPVVHGLARRRRTRDQPRAQGLAFEQLHGRVGHAFLAAEVEDGQDARVGEGGHRLGFALEAREGFAVLRHAGRTLTATVRSSRLSRAR